MCFVVSKVACLSPSPSVTADRAWPGVWAWAWAWSLPQPRGLLDIGTTNLAVSVQIGETAFQRVPIPLAIAIG